MVKEIENWINLIEEKDQPPQSGMVAFHFGLFETEEGFGVYLTGSKEYDAEDDAWISRKDFVPKKYPYLMVEITIPDKKWEEFLELILEELQIFKSTDNFQNCFLSNSKVITTGFDDGELYVC